MWMTSCRAAVVMMSWVGVAHAQSASFLEYSVYESQDAYLADPFWGGVSVADGGTVYDTEHTLMHRSSVRGMADGDVWEWFFYRPDGSVHRHYTETYTTGGADGPCWTGLVNYCGAMSSFRWSFGHRVLGERLGTWTVEVVRNGDVLLTNTFVLAGDPDAPPPPPEPPEPTSLLAVSAPLGGVPGDALAEPVRVQLLDADGQPVSGTRVTFAIDDPSGAKGTMLTAGVTVGGLVHTTTDAGGFAAASVVLGSKTGTYTVTATADAVDPVAFDITAAPLEFGLVRMWSDQVPLARYDDDVFYEATVGRTAFSVVEDEAVGALLGEVVPIAVELGSVPVSTSWTPAVVWEATIDGVTAGSGQFQGWDAVVELVPPVSGLLPIFEDFGAKDLGLTFWVYDDQGELVDTVVYGGEMDLFFRRDYTDEGVPNWARYWSQVPAILELEADPYAPERKLLGRKVSGSLLPKMWQRGGKLAGTESDPGDSQVFLYTHPGTTHSHIMHDDGRCEQASNGGSAYGYWYYPDPYLVPYRNFEEPQTDIFLCMMLELDHDIVEFATTITHEHTHITDWYAFWGPHADVDADADGDFIPDGTEYAFRDSMAHLQDDSEHFTAASEALLLADDDYVERLRAQDWAFPGSQTLSPQVD